MTKNFITSLIIISFTLTLLLGCEVLKPTNTPEMHNFQINPTESANLCSNATGNTITVMLMKTHYPYNTRKMIYIDNKYEILNYTYHQWVSSPNVMLTKAITIHLLNSCNYKNVVNEDSAVITDYRLNTELLYLSQVNKDNHYDVILSVLVQLIANDTNKIIKSKVFTKSITVDEITPYKYTVNADQVTKLFLSDLQIWLSEK